MNNNQNINFNKAIELCSQNFNHEELIKMIQSENITEKQFGILNLDNLRNDEEAYMFCSNLTGQDGKIREAVSFKLVEFFNNSFSLKFLIHDSVFKTMLEGLMDINGNVCRNILEIQNNEFNKYISENIIEKIVEVLNHISDLTKEDMKYVISKRFFQLYWALEGIYKIKDKISLEILKEILYKTAKFEDYTIREKTAKILLNYKNIPTDLIQLFDNEDNYYVKRYSDKLLKRNDI